jgi:hypothetical protein
MATLNCLNSNRGIIAGLTAATADTRGLTTGELHDTTNGNRVFIAGLIA